MHALRGTTVLPPRRTRTPVTVGELRPDGRLDRLMKVRKPHRRSCPLSTNHLSVVKRLKSLAIGAVSIAAVATGAYALGPVAPAHAATTYGGCTITPTLPTADSAVSPTGETLVNYRGGVFCPLGKTARVQRERWEQDLGPPISSPGPPPLPCSPRCGGTSIPCPTPTASGTTTRRSIRKCDCR